jgi:putative hydrolase of the HAD superfamily
MIRAVLFDMGGVLVTSPFVGIAEYERRAGLPAGIVRRMNATEPDTNAWAHYERGDIDRVEFVRRFAAEGAALGHEVDGAAVLDALRGDPIDEMLLAVGRIRAERKTAMLTNNLSPMDPTAPVARRLLPLFDTVVQSAVEGVRKPDPRFYLLACERLEVEPSECVFLDDLGINCKPARALGMHTIKVTDPLDAIGELEALLDVTLR